MFIHSISKVYHYKCHTRNIPGIFQVYPRYIQNANPWTSCRIRLQGWPRGFYSRRCLKSGHLPYNYLYLPHISQGYSSFNIFNPLNLLNLWLGKHEEGRTKQFCYVIPKGRKEEGIESAIWHRYFLWQWCGRSCCIRGKEKERKGTHIWEFRH